MTSAISHAQQELRPPETGQANDRMSGDVHAANDQPTFEHSLAELEAIVHDLEEGQLGLDEALARYEQGVKHLKHCYQLLARAEQKIELLTGVADDGTPITEPLEQQAEPLAESAGRRRRPKAPHAPIPSPDDEISGDIDASSTGT